MHRNVGNICGLSVDGPISDVGLTVLDLEAREGQELEQLPP